jgi:hypothetical protein
MKSIRKSAILLLGLVYFLTASVHAQESRLENNGTFVFNSSSMLFVAVERHEVRVEIMVKGIPLMNLLDFDTEGETIAIDQQARLKNQALKFFEDRFVLSLEGIPAKAGTAKADFLNVGDANSVIKGKAVDEPLADAVLGLSYIFPVDQVPEYFQFAWSKFPDGLGELPAQIRVLDKVQKFELNKYMLTIDWNSGNLNFQLPAISPVPVKEADWLGRAKLDKSDAFQVVGQLLKNIYSAFEYRDESAIYDKLAVSVSGKQIASIYLEQRKRMDAVSRGGPRVQIHDVSMCEIEELVKSGRSFKMKGIWEVSGKVTHFGHTHDRRNRYGAKLTLLSNNKQWKIIDIDVIEENRIL